MDMTLTIAANKFDITLFKKPLNLYLYIPPSSAHPLGMIIGLLYGMVLCLLKLCSKVSDVQRLMKTFFCPLLRRGYSKYYLLPLFAKANENAHDSTSEEFKVMQDKNLSKDLVVSFSSTIPSQ
jgi:hypothetical protein